MAAATADHGNPHGCFLNWIAQQHRDLDELVHALTTNADEEQLNLLREKAIQHFEEYGQARAAMVEHHAPSLMTPRWCTPFENAFLWIGGCRPSLGIRLVYSVCGSEVEAGLSEFLRGSDQERNRGNLAELTGRQLDQINTLHAKIVQEEGKMSSRMATIQEEMADEPLASIAKSLRCIGEWCSELDRAMNAHSLSLAGILADTDSLRLATFKDLITILTPLQAASFSSPSRSSTSPSSTPGLPTDDTNIYIFIYVG